MLLRGHKMTAGGLQLFQFIYLFICFGLIAKNHTDQPGLFKGVSS